MAGNISQQWLAAASPLAWAASSGPDGLANSTLSNASGALSINGITSVKDIQLTVMGQTIAGTLASPPLLNLYVAASIDGTNWPPNNTNSLRYANSQQIIAANAIEYSEIISLAQLFGGTLPNSIKVSLYNSTGLALAGTAGNNTAIQVLYRAIGIGY